MSNTSTTVDKAKASGFSENGYNESSVSELQNPTLVCEASVKQQIFSILFVNNKPISLSKLAEILDVEDTEQLLSIMEEVNNAAKELGIEVAEISGGFQLRTIKECAPIIRKVVKAQTKKLTKATAETLALIAYRQPITKADIESVRGVDSTPTLKTLIEMKLVQGMGRDDSPGSPILYGTTSAFLERFGLKSLKELPNKRETEELEQAQADI